MNAYCRVPDQCLANTTESVFRWQLTSVQSSATVRLQQEVPWWRESIFMSVATMLASLNERFSWFSLRGWLFPQRRSVQVKFGQQIHPRAVLQVYKFVSRKWRAELGRDISCELLGSHFASFAASWRVAARDVLWAYHSVSRLSASWVERSSQGCLVDSRSSSEVRLWRGKQRAGRPRHRLPHLRLS